MFLFAQRHTSKIAKTFLSALLILCLGLATGCDQPESNSKIAQVEQSANQVETTAPKKTEVSKKQDVTKSQPGDSMDDINEEKKVFLSEEVIIALGPSITNLNRSVANLSLPDVNSRAFFSDEINVLDISTESESQSELLESVGTRTLKWLPVDQAVKKDNASLSIWKPMFDEVDYFYWSKFAIKKGEFLDSTMKHYKTLILFSAKAHMKSGKLLTFDSSAIVKWKLLTDSDGTDAWKIVEWKSQPTKLLETNQQLFRDVLPEVLQDEKEYAEARKSIHEQLVVRVIRGEIGLPLFFRIRELHPAVSVVDLNEDGYDDFYISRRRGKSLFYSSQGDGTYREIGAELGIDVIDYNISSIFADFDNDGDKDLFVGRMWGPSKYFVNTNGKFEECSELFDSDLPQFVGSVNAVDYDQDGLLDIYVAVFGGKDCLIRAKMRSGEFPWPENEVKILKKLDLMLGTDVLNTPALPSVVFRNLGNGKFERASVPAIQVFRKTLQATWSDFDLDGDPDLYVANDKGLNNLVRNDGDGNFVDITHATKTADLGFGMGVSAGDYNNDGMHDIYVVNMYSKAGQRITGQLPSIKKGYSEAAKGNSLFKNNGLEFDKVSGMKAPKVMVENAGWSWGGQFIDFDNDSFLDIYALSGHYTAPKKISRPGDI